MKNYRKELFFNVPVRRAFINITKEVEEAVEKSNVNEGFCLVNADAHLKRQVMGREVVVAITDGKLDFGPWEQIFYGEFDGRRKKRVLIKIIGE